MNTNKEITQSLTVREPQNEDVNLIYALIHDCNPLDTNSFYSYLLICTHFNKTSAVIELNDQIAGYVSAYISPNNNDTLFIWQVAVSPQMRRRGLASIMIKDIIQRKELENINYIEATVAPSNNASMALFQKLASSLKTKCEKLEFFRRELFEKYGHDEELLLRIGPIT